MSKYSQKTIEYFFDKYNVTDQKQKEKILLHITDTIYDYNMAVVSFEKSKDKYKQKQLAQEIDELEEKIKEIIDEAKK